MPYLPDFTEDRNKFKSYDIDTTKAIELPCDSKDNHIGRNYYLIELED